MFPKIGSWNEFKNHLEAKSALEKGTAFEELTKLYLEYHPVYRTKLKTVWLQKEIPTTVRESLNLPSNDQGIDLVAETYEGTYWAIQCKYLQDENQTLSHRSISTFVSLSTGIAEQIAHCLVCTTVDDYAKIYKGRKNIGFINADEWRKLDQEFFDWCRARAKGQSLKLTPSQARPHQQKALDSAQMYFGQEGNHRGKLIFPCGAGKSLTGFWMLQQLKARSTLIAVPSLALVKQTLDVYLREIVALDRKVKWLCVCSDEGIGKDDDVVFYTENLGVPCLTDPAYIQNWLQQNKNEEIILFTTYQSGRIVGEACQKLNFTFDLGIFDEAHKTVGAEKKLFSYLLFDENIGVQKRIFMTATERFYRGSKDDIISMDDEAIYGETFAHMSFKEAIDLGLLTDYKVITIEVSKAEIADFIKENHLVQTNAKWNKDTEARSLASMLALRKAMDRYPIRNAVSFHSSIDKAIRNKDLQGHISTTYHYEPVDAFTVSGKVPTSKRNRIIQEFAQSPKAVITNARCLTEGVDVPNIDCIVYADPRKSKVDIVQALGRALRKKEGKGWGYVVLPVIYNAVSHEIDNENFQEILSVVRGLASNDERIVDYFKDQADPKKATKKSDQQFQLQVLTEFMDEMELSSQLHIRLWEKLSRFSWMPYEEAKAIVNEMGITSSSLFNEAKTSSKLPYNIPSHPFIIYQNTGWTNWGDFLGTNRISSNLRVYLNYEDAKKHATTLNLKSNKEWVKLKRKGFIPDNLPTQPGQTYKGKGWVSWGEFLGTGKIANYYLNFLSFEEAKEFVSTLKLNSISEWLKYCKSGKKPLNIPSTPSIVYKEKWSGFGDFLGTGRIPTINREYLSYQNCKEYIRKLNIQSYTDWREFTKSSDFPQNVPRSPDRKYSGSGWISWFEFLDREKIEYLSLQEAMNVVTKLKITSKAEYHYLFRINELPKGLPKSPNVTYKFKGWVSWEIFFGNHSNIPSNYLNYDEAKLIVKNLGIKSINSWKEKRKLMHIPSGIPSHPNIVYKEAGWSSWADFFGTNNRRDIDYLPFEEAKKIVRAEGLKSNQHWRKYSQTKRPLNIPGSPDSIYKNKGWTNWGDFLGTGNERKIEFLSYEEARAFIRTIGLKSSIDWREYSKTKRPRNIPGNPDRDYVGKGWISWNDFLGSNTISNYQKSFIEFDKAKELISSYNLRSLNDWNDFCKAGKKPINIPRNPAQYYFKKGWKGWHDFLSVPSDYKKLNEKYLNFEEAKTYVHTLNLKRYDDWINFCKDGKKPQNIPTNPGSVYKKLGWKNMGDWLGTGRLGTKNRQYWPFTKSRSYVHKLKLKNEGKWRTYTKSGKLPVDIPNTPQKIYTNEWMGFGDWLGTGNIAPNLKKFMTYLEAKKFVSKFKLKTINEFKIFCQSPNRPPDLPTNPNSTYKNSGWISFGEFLGTGTVAPGLQEYLDFPEVKIAVKALNLNSRGEWEKYCKSGNKPKNVPASPQYVYKNKGWKGWPDFLGKI